MEPTGAACAPTQAWGQAPAPPGVRDSQCHVRCAPQWLCLAPAASCSATVEDRVPLLPALAPAGPLGAAAYRLAGGSACASRTRAATECRAHGEPIGQDDRGGGRPWV